MIISPDASGQIDGSVQKHIFNHLPPLSIDIVPISWFPTFQFKQPETSKYVLIDFMESHAPSDEYDKFWKWVAQNPPPLHFKRELTKEETKYAAYRPIEWAAYLPFTPVQTKEEYEARPIDVLFFWGYSNLSRPRLHGEIFEKGFKDGFNVLDCWDDLGKPDLPKHTWATIYAPYWRRKPMEEILPIMRQSKITVSLPGNGKKTFRDTEVIDSLMARHDDGMAFSFPWDNTNSLLLTPEEEYRGLLNELITPNYNLYDKYVKCHENMQRYGSDRYVNEYLIPEIQKWI